MLKDGNQDTEKLALLVRPRNLVCEVTQALHDLPQRVYLKILISNYISIGGKKTYFLKELSSKPGNEIIFCSLKDIYCDQKKTLLMVPRTALFQNSSSSKMF